MNHALTGESLFAAEDTRLEQHRVVARVEHTSQDPQPGYAAAGNGNVRGMYGHAGKRLVRRW